jgi:hypothetical protein
MEQIQIMVDTGDGTFTGVELYDVDRYEEDAFDAPAIGTWMDEEDLELAIARLQGLLAAVRGTAPALEAAVQVPARIEGPFTAVLP